MGEKMTLEQVRDELMTQREIEGDKPITEFYERIIAAIDAHLATQRIDLAAVREVITQLKNFGFAEIENMDKWADKLSQAIGDKT